MHQKKKELLLTILNELRPYWELAPLLTTIVYDPDTPTHVFDMILEFINRSRQNIDIKKEFGTFLADIQKEIQYS
jgi:hypothetical protein